MSRFAWKSDSSPIRQSGFTLLEVVVAFSIFAVIGLSAHQFLRTIINTREVTNQSNAVMSSASRAFSVMQRDFSHLADRQVRDAYGEPLPPLIVGTGDYDVEFSRSGWNNPARLPRSNMQRVAYGLNDDDELERYFWLVLDRAEDSEPIIQRLLTDVEDFRINLMSSDGGFVDTWPDFDNDARLPRAVEILITHKKLGELRKLYSVVMTADANTSESQGNAETNPGDQNGNSEDAETDSRGNRGDSNVRR